MSELETRIEGQEFNHAHGFPDIFTNGIPKGVGASISGGTDRLSYFFSADYNRDEGYLDYNRQNKYNARGNITYRNAITDLPGYAANNFSLGATIRL